MRLRLRVKDPADVLLHGMMELIDEYERLSIALRLRRGRPQKVRDGGHAGGLPPYGYQATRGGKRLDLHPEEAPTVRRIFNLRRSGLGAYAIAARLNGDAIATREGKAWSHKPRVVGSNPIARSNPHQDCVSAVVPFAETAQEADAHPLHEAIEAFLLTKQVGGCTQATIRTYRWWLDRFTRAPSEVTPLSMRQFFVGLQHHSPSHQHQAYRTLKTFFRWCVETGLQVENPLRGFTMRTPKRLPTVPTEDELGAVLAACSDTLEGARNRALILALADSGLRAGEVLHLLIEDWRPADRGLFVRAGKGRKDRVAFIGPTTTRALKAWLARHPLPSPEAFLFCDHQGRPLKPRHLVQILHRLSAKTGLPPHRRLHPHALRHFAATSWLRGGAGLDEVRRLLGHESLSTTLRYSSLVGADLQRAHRKAGAIERLRLD